MKKIGFIFCIFYGLLTTLRAENDVFNDYVYEKNVKTVQFSRGGVWLSNPVMVLNSDVQLVLSFDILELDARNLYYKVLHCQSDWRKSDLYYEEYLNGFEENPLEDFAFSINTTTPYVNYKLTLPNEKSSVRISGNYVVVIYDKDRNDELVLVKRFFVIEPLVNVNGKIKNALNLLGESEKQEIDFSINIERLRPRNPMRDVTVVIKQNWSDDFLIKDLKPSYIDNTRLEYNYDDINLFEGMNEYRIFDTRPVRYTGEQVVGIEYHAPFYHVTVFPQKERKRDNYSFYKEMNGKYFIEAKQTDQPDVAADYQIVHFSLEAATPYLDGDIYVYGELSNWQCTSDFKMTWDPNRKQYELAVLLKQGYYNYVFARFDSDTNKVDCSRIEGSFKQTENDYQIFVYYKGMSDRYEKLVGYQKFNSNIDRDF